jgi:hypothetical protein
MCCARKREVEIDCPLSCAYLREGYSYEQGKTPVENRTAQITENRTFDRSFIIANEPFLLHLWQVIWETFQSVPQIHDSDILSAFTALEKTYRTLDTGLYYDSKPAQSVPQMVYLKLKEAIDAQLANPDANKPHVKLSTVLDCLVFQQQLVQMRSSERPLSRGFLLQLQEVFARTPQSSKSEPSSIVLG